MSLAPSRALRRAVLCAALAVTATAAACDDDTNDETDVTAATDATTGDTTVADTSQTPAPDATGTGLPDASPDATPTPRPRLTIVSPADGATLDALDVTVTVRVDDGDATAWEVALGDDAPVTIDGPLA